MRIFDVLLHRFWKDIDKLLKFLEDLPYVNMVTVREHIAKSQPLDQRSDMISD